MSGRAGPGPSHANRSSQRDGGDRGASKRRHGGADDSTSLSRKLTKLLRHSAKQRGLHIRPDGFVQLSEVLSLPEFRGLGIEQVRQVSANEARLAALCPRRVENYRLSRLLFGPEIHSSPGMARFSCCCR
jgi:hypothetical protein